MASVSFDPVADHYDATRGYPAAVAQQITRDIDQAVGGDTRTRFLEVGIGTGRIALPLLERGRQYTGIDISAQMLNRLAEKLRGVGWQKQPLVWGDMPDEDAARDLEVQRFVHAEKQGTLRLLVSDMTAIPFQDQSFDSVVAVHVFHLVSEWQQALQEIMRVLRHPGGMLIRCWDENWHENWQKGQRDTQGDIKKQWSKIIQELGGSTELPGANEQEVTQWLQQQGYVTEQVGVVAWERTATPRFIIEGIEQRIWTSTLFVPDDMFAVSLQHLRQWADEHYGASLDTPHIQHKRFVISRTLMTK